MKNFKRIGAALLSLTLALGLTACGSKPESASGSAGETQPTKLYVVNWKDYASDDEELMAAFEAEYNCEIVNTYMEREEQLLPSLKTASAGQIAVCRSGAGVDFSEETAKPILLEKEIHILVSLNSGAESATAWGGDLTYDYVKINGDYRT